MLSVCQHAECRNLNSRISANWDDWEPTSRGISTVAELLVHDVIVICEAMTRERIYERQSLVCNTCSLPARLSRLYLLYFPLIFIVHEWTTQKRWVQTDFVAGWVFNCWLVHLVWYCWRNEDYAELCLVLRWRNICWPKKTVHGVCSNNFINSK